MLVFQRASRDEEGLAGDGEELVGRLGAVGVEHGLVTADHALAEAVVLGHQHGQPGFAGLVCLQQRHAIGQAVAHVQHMRELVDHDVVGAGLAESVSPPCTSGQHSMTGPPSMASPASTSS